MDTNTVHNRDPVSDDAPVEPIVFCRESKRALRRAQTERQAAINGMLFLAMAVGVLVGAAADRAAGNRWLTAGVLCGYAAILGAVVLARWLKRRGKFMAIDVAGATPDARLVCVAPPDWIVQHGELRDVPFEPAIFPARYARDFTRHMKIAAAGTAVPTFVLIWWAAGWLGVRNALSFGYILGWASLTAGHAVAMGLWPTYYRIVPGRLDVMRFSLLGNQVISLDRYDLRQSRIEIDLRRYVACVGDAADAQPAASDAAGSSSSAPPTGPAAGGDTTVPAAAIVVPASAPGAFVDSASPPATAVDAQSPAAAEIDPSSAPRVPPTGEFPLMLMRRRTEFAHALLLAAISTHEAPPLPEDALLG